MVCVKLTCSKLCIVCGQPQDFSGILMNVHFTSQRLHRGSKRNLVSQHTGVQLVSPSSKCLGLMLSEASTSFCIEGSHDRCPFRLVAILLSTENAPFEQPTHLYAIVFLAKSIVACNALGPLMLNNIGHRLIRLRKY